MILKINPSLAVVGTWAAISGLSYIPILVFMIILLPNELIGWAFPGALMPAAVLGFIGVWVFKSKSARWGKGAILVFILGILLFGGLMVVRVKWLLSHGRGGPPAPFTTNRTFSR